MLPYTHDDWKRTINEIKRQHVSRRYRTCSARCCEILDNVRHASQVEPVYLIYLHFYAATSMELCAKPLASTSPYRTSLLRQARGHFDQAGSLIETAMTSVADKMRPESVVSSRSSNCQSPAESVSSRAWTPETRLSSPTNSVYSFEDLPNKDQAGQKRCKKVSFSLPDQQPVMRISEPYIRPDSPTLGFEDDYFHAGAARAELPALPSPPPKAAKDMVDMPLGIGMGMDRLEEQLIPESEEEGEEGFRLAQSVDRYCDHLSGLRAQLLSHTAHLDALLEPKTGHKTPDVLERTSPDDDLRALDRRARIERLRKNGWQRKRFDASRYEELCDNAMAELQ
jgi:hypothetical protein